MPFEIRRLDDVIAVDLIPECTPEDLAAIGEKAVPLLAEGARHLILDAMRVEYVGSSFVGRLLALRKQFDDHEGRMIIVRPARILSRVVEALGLLELLEIEDSEDAALRALRGE